MLVCRSYDWERHVDRISGDPVIGRLQVILFAIFAIAAAFPEQERERRGILAAPALASPWLAGPKIAAAPIAVAAVPKLLAAREYLFVSMFR